VGPHVWVLPFLCLTGQPEKDLFGSITLHLYSVFVTITELRRKKDVMAVLGRTLNTPGTGSRHHITMSVEE
jgi:hypothetical protein